MSMQRIQIIFLLLAVWLGGYAANGVIEQSIVYTSVDQRGEPIRLSGMLCVPEGKTPKGIILIPHFTITAKDDSPSVKPTGESRGFRDDYVLVMPDFIGYGITSDRIHPYLAGELTARNAVDMLLAVQPVLDSMALGIPTDSIYLLGFSQGGASALWILQLLEQQYADRIFVKKCFVGGGPYDVASTFDEAVMLNRVNLPLTIPMLVIGTSEAYGLDLQFDSIMSPAMISYNDKYVASKQYRIPQLFFRFPNRKVTHWITPYGMDKTRPETQRLYAGFLRSSLVHYPIGDGTENSICPQWTPQTPLFVFHSTQDDIVTVRNAEHLKRCYDTGKTITWDIGNYGSHYLSGKTFYRKVKQQMP